jgi:hypothetical protein
VVRLVLCDPHGEAQPLAPGAFGEFFDFPLAAAEGPFAVFGVGRKALEIAEMVENQADNLAGEREAVFFITRVLRATAASRGGEDLARVAARR